jgi:probable phosphoglycerate mutase
MANSTPKARSKAAGSRRKPTQRPTTIVLVRHGQTPSTGSVLPGRAPGLHLSETGHQQARRAAERLVGLSGLAAIYHSPLERARETAAPIATALDMRSRVERGLIECDFGDWTGQRLDRLAKLPEWTSVQRTPSTFRFPNGESFADMQHRMVTTLERLRDRHRGQTVICVSHADPIKAAVAHAMGVHLDLFQRIVISTCSVSVLAWHGGGPVSLTVNSTGGSIAELTMS